MAEVRDALRSLRRNPGFTFNVLITLALAVGANSAVFTLANALIFASLPVPRADRLVQISTADSKGGKSGLSIPAFQALEREMRQVFLSMLAWNGGGVENLEMNGVAFAGSVDDIAGDYYSTLGIRPAVGRLTTREDVGLGHFTPSRVAVIGHRVWQERYHGDPGVLGKRILINGEPYQIIGVHPRSFPGLIREAAADATIPLTAAATSAERLSDPKHDYYTVIGRLRDGVDVRAARARLEAIWPACDSRRRLRQDRSTTHFSRDGFRSSRLLQAFRTCGNALRGRFIFC